jgi:cbb3-type cytochrome oxidase maturation protein
MIAYYIIVLGSVVCLTGSALLALRWALRNGQFQHLSRTALQIFDEEEPVGRMADRFPDTPNASFAQITPAPTPHPSPLPRRALGRDRGEGADTPNASCAQLTSAATPHPSPHPRRALGRDQGEGADGENKEIAS